jgi:hypothetical protein
MARIGKTQRRRIALVISLAAAFAALSPWAPTANGGVLEQLTRPVEEVVTPVVGATPTVQQVGETVTTTAQEATAGIAPPATKSAAATAAPAATAAASTGPADAVTDRVKKLVAGHEATAAVESAAAAATKTAEAAVPAATADAEEATGAALPDPSVPSTAAADLARPGAGPADNVTGAADSSPVPTDLPPAAPRTTYVPPPGEDGSTGAPLPRYVAFVWPAVALAGPSLAQFGQSWGQAIVRLATGATAADGSGGGEGGVAGVHASGGRPEGSSVPLFSTLPADVGHVFSNVPTPIFIYLGLLVLAVIAVALGVRREMAAGRRPY